MINLVGVQGEEGPEDGHTFEISVRSRGSYAVVGEPHHDANWWDEPYTIQVRAWSLRAALQKIVVLPLSAWTLPPEEE